MKVWFPNFPLRLIPRALKVRDDKVYELVFKTVPSVGKFDLKRFLESVYGYDVEKVNTVVYEGKKKRDRYGFYRRPDWKKAYVTLRTPLDKPPAADG